MLELLLAADKEPEGYACAFWTAIVDTEIESRLIAIIGNKKDIVNRRRCTGFCYLG